MDDNRAPFALMEFADPAGWMEENGRPGQTSITEFIVPLYPKIYLDALRFRDLILRLLANPSFAGEAPSQPKFLRSYLTTARSFKAGIVKSSLPFVVKKIIVRLEMPKFIWVAEEATPVEYDQGRGSGFLVLDATGDASERSLIFSCRSGCVGLWIKQKWLLRRIHETFEFGLYQNNLKGKWNNWRA